MLPFVSADHLAPGALAVSVVSTKPLWTAEATREDGSLVGAQFVAAPFIERHAAQGNYESNLVAGVLPIQFTLERPRVVLYFDLPLTFEEPAAEVVRRAVTQHRNATRPRDAGPFYQAPRPLPRWQNADTERVVFRQDVADVFQYALTVLQRHWRAPSAGLAARRPDIGLQHVIDLFALALDPILRAPRTRGIELRLKPPCIDAAPMEIFVWENGSADAQMSETHPCHAASIALFEALGTDLTMRGVIKGNGAPASLSMEMGFQLAALDTAHQRAAALALAHDLLDDRGRHLLAVALSVPPDA